MLHMKITIETTVNAPVEDVWRAWTTPDDIKQWNTASEDWHTTRASVDLRVGGSFSSRMEAKDGSMGFDFAGTYTKIVANELIECWFGERTLRCASSFLREPAASPCVRPSTPNQRIPSSSSVRAGSPF